ncbi:MAG: hypothetical protein IPJ27_15190 [Candidatus Accumulibacter sp.]|uniref:Uncharacterized protein n=1 Tax=Candidatus Accumulibacter proximus TaxID=2954385 RepID=A0A935UHY8_9PROT|nr:hypothetical protein [Candidatus Accumulibacter proximus]
MMAIFLNGLPAATPRRGVSHIIELLAAIRVTVFKLRRHSAICPLADRLHCRLAGCLFNSVSEARVSCLQHLFSPS